MRGVKSLIAAGAACGVIAAGAWAVTTTSASAETVCNRWHECWHVHNHIADYPADLGVTYYPDTWRGHHNHWRTDRDDHGYYRNGAWVAF